MNHELDGIATVRDAAVSPDGRVVVAVSRIDVVEDRYVNQIWTSDGEHSRPLTSGPGDSAPAFSPDGASLAFLRVVDSRPQVAVLPLAGGEATVVTDFALGVTGPPVWSPDSSRLAVVGQVWLEDTEEVDADERARRPRRIAERFYRADGVGWIYDRVTRVFVVDPAGGEPRRLGSDDDVRESAPTWSPDGDRIAFIVAPIAGAGFRLGNSVRVITVDDGTTLRDDIPGQWVTASYRPDGVLHALGASSHDFPSSAMLWRLDDAPVLVNTGDARSVFSFTAGTPWVRWDGDEALIQIVDAGAIGVARVTTDGIVTEEHLSRSVVTGYDRGGDVVALVESTVSNPGRLTILTDGNEQVADEFGGVAVATIEPHHQVIEGPGGPLDVWVYLPDGEATVPLLLNIHGGPASQYGWGFFDEFQVYVDAGYGVVATNPRGSAGRDQEFLRAISGDGWGRVDVEDIDAVVRASLDAHPRLDANRMGVMGGSYGGFLTAWLTAHQQRWKSAIVERALVSWPTFAGTSDIGGWFGDEYIGDDDLAWDRSPLRVADRTTTPTLVIHSEEDHRCPIEQAEQYFSILLANGVETEFIRFPGEGHELSRSGKPRHRQERFELILDWLNRTLR